MKNLADKTKDYEAATAGLGLQTHFKKYRQIEKSYNKIRLQNWLDPIVF